MKYRAPRKKKKIAKRKKSMNDAMVMARTAIITASSYAQMSIINSTLFTARPLRLMKIAEVAINTAKAVSLSMGDIKHWTNFIPNYRR